MTTAHIDAAVASHIDAHLSTQDSDDEDALINALEADTETDPALTQLREQRLEQLHNEFTRAKAQRNAGFGTYLEMKTEKELMELTTGTHLVVVHFSKPDFHRCGVMDRHLEVCMQGCCRPTMKYGSHGLTGSTSRRWLRRTSTLNSSRSTSKTHLFWWSN